MGVGHYFSGVLGCSIWVVSIALDVPTVCSDSGGGAVDRFNTAVQVLQFTHHLTRWALLASACFGVRVNTNVNLAHADQCLQHLAHICGSLREVNVLAHTNTLNQLSYIAIRSLDGTHRAEVAETARHVWQRQHACLQNLLQVERWACRQEPDG